MTTKFLKDLKKETDDCLQSLNRRIKDTGKAIQDSLKQPKSAKGTPRITGHLYNNWVVTINDEWLDIDGSRENPSNSVQTSNWAKFLGMDNLYLQENIYWNNNVYYGKWVNYGTDEIKAQKFREKAIQSGEEYLKTHRTK